MSFWRRIRRIIAELLREDYKLLLDLEPHTFRMLRETATREKRSEVEVASELLKHALIVEQAGDENVRLWGTLTPREQQVVALTCMNLTNRQIGYVLGISSSTAKTHISNALRKFELNSKQDLRVQLANWDFSEYKTWE